MATIYYGMCHTYIYNQSLNLNSFGLDPDLNYRIFIHDSKYNHLLLRRVFPRILLQYKSGQNIVAGTYDYYELSVIEHHLLNRPEQPCEEEEDYDFLQCVKTSQARMTGCRPPWDSWSPATIPLCQTMEKLDKHEVLDMKIGTMERKKILAETGCRIPCKYKVGSDLILT